MYVAYVIGAAHMRMCVRKIFEIRRDRALHKLQCIIFFIMGTALGANSFL